MNRKQAFIGLLSVAFLFMATDFFINGYYTYLIPKSEVSVSLESQSTLPKSFFKALPKTVEVKESIPATTLFNRLIVSELNLQEAVQTPLFEGVQKFGIIYEFSGGESVYFQLHSALELILNKDDTIVDANNLGDYSMYYNDAQRPESVFLLALIKGRVWGFEYPRKHHEAFKKLTQILIEQDK